jgi:FMN-dependent oxidoreductase (nitrilotriacetate monooxygenase family)
VQIPSVDPVLLLPALAAVTRHLGFAVTYSTTYHPPYECARLFSSLDHLTGGRVAWNIVTSYLRSASANGLGEFLAHDQRYERADEYLKVVRALWEDSWRDDAVVRDGARDMFVNPDRVREIAHEGRWFRVRGPHQCEPSPQRTPVLYQAGASPRGMRFAAQHAEVVFITLPDPTSGAQYVTELRQRVASGGRDGRAIKLLQAAYILVGRTREEARAKADALAALTSNEGELAKWCGWMDFNLAAFPDDTPMSDIRVEGSRSVLEFLRRIDGERSWTVADVRAIVLLSRRPHRRMGWLHGTPARIADWMEEWLEVADVDGFNLIPAPPSAGVDDICDLLVPELQRRGLFRRAYDAAERTLRERYFGAGRARCAWATKEVS